MSAASQAIPGQPVVGVAAPKVSVWKNILQHVKQFFNVALTDIITYTPKAEALAEVLLPEYAGLEQKASAMVVSAFTLLRNTVLTIEQKYSDDTASDTTNAKKLADALALAGAPAEQLLTAAGVKVDDTRMTGIVNGIVAILKTSTAPTT